MMEKMITYVPLTLLKRIQFINEMPNLEAIQKNIVRITTQNQAKLSINRGWGQKEMGGNDNRERESEKPMKDCGINRRHGGQWKVKKKEVMKRECEYLSLTKS